MPRHKTEHKPINFVNAVIIVDEQQRVFLFNAAAETLFGLSANQAMGQPITRFIPEGLPLLAGEATGACAGTEMAAAWLGEAGETQGLRADGQTLSLEGAVFRSRAGASHQFTLILKDITERKRDEEALRCNELLFRRLAEANLIGVGFGDTKGNVIFVNDELLRMMGYTREDYQASRINWVDCVAPEYREDNLRFEELLLRDGQIIGYERAFLRPDGGRTPYLGAAALVTPGNDLHVSIALDLTQIRAAEEALRVSEARFRQLADAMPQIVWTADPDGTVDYYNHRINEFAGVERNPDATWVWQPILHPDDLDHTLATWKTAVATGQPYQCEHRVRMVDGSYRWHLSRAVPVQDAADHVVKFFGTATDIHDLKLAQEALRETDRRKNEFLATLAHELRNPLAPIRNAAQVFKLENPPDSPLYKAQEVIERQLQHMVRLIDDLLDVSRITSGKLHLRKERVELALVLQHALEASGPHAERAGHEPMLSLPSQPIYLDADPVRLAQIFANLLDNAYKYTPRGGRIALTVEQEQAQVVVKVVDTGMGILPEHLPRLFEMFSQLGAAAEQPQGGLGIGLALARRLVEMHGGSIEARSDGLNKGSEFIVRLPVLVEKSAVQLPQPHSLDTIEIGMARRILAVDDNRDSVESLATVLRLTGNEVETAHDGLEAVKAAERYRPDIILLDIGMPKLDGYGACRRIREQPWGRDIMIIAITGWGQDEDRRKSKEAGFNRHLVKPVELSMLLNLLAEPHISLE